MSPIASALLGLVVGVVVGGLATWRIVTRNPVRADSAAPPASAPPGPAEPELEELHAGTSRVDEGGLKNVIDASRNLVEDLERRYSRPDPAGGEPGAPARPKGGRRRPPA